MDDNSYNTAMLKLIQDNPQYDRHALDFVYANVVSVISEKAIDPHCETRHVSGPAIIDGVIGAAVSRFDVFAAQVFRSWNIMSSMDIGYIIFKMIDYGILFASPDDRLEDFKIFPDLPAEIEKRLPKHADIVLPPPDPIE